MKQKWNTTMYNDNHSFVYKFGEALVNMLNPQKNERILDLGCGSGQLTAQIADLAGEVVGIDQSPDMIGQAKSDYGHLNFKVADATDFYFEEKFDAIFSNAVLHWVKNYEASIMSMSKNLKPGGRLVLEFGGKNNIGNMLSVLKSELKNKGYVNKSDMDLWYYPSIGEYATELEKQGFRILKAEHYDRWTALKGDDGMKNWFLMFASKYFEDIKNDEVNQILDQVCDNLKSEHFVNDIWYADYKRIRVVAVKEN